VKELARRGKVQAVVFWSLHRTGRNKVQIAQDIRDLVSYKVRVVSVMQSWLDAAPESPLTGLLVDIMGFFAEGEREELIERTRRGLGRAKAAGRIGGRPRAVDLETVELASAKVLAGMSWSEVARELGVKPQTLRTACIRRNAAPV
jgi:DNA invertase Pin-like site-specific DNA recombinase